MLTRRLCLALVAACAWSCAATAPRASRPAPALSAAQESQVGTAIDLEVRRELGVLNEPGLQREVQQVGARLAAVAAPGGTWHFTVLDVAAPTALALPGGFVYVTRGLLPYLANRSELAAVLAHELAHVTRGDATRAYLGASAAEPFTEGVFHPLARAFSRAAPRLNAVSLTTLLTTQAPDTEGEANAAAVAWLVQAGFNRSSLADALDALERLDLESDARGLPTWPMTHGRNEEQRRALRAAAGSASRPPAPAPPAADAFVADHVRRLLFGDDPREGLVRGNEVIKANLQVAVDVPLEWDVSADQTRLLVRGPDAAALLVQFVPGARGRQVPEVAATLVTRAGFHALSGSATTINGLPAFLGSAEGRLDGAGDVRASVGCVRTARGVFLLIGAAANAGYPLVGPQLDAAIRSFRSLSAAEVRRVLPERIDLDTARDGDTWESIARRHGGLVMASMLALLNHAADDRPPAAGASLKVVVASEK